MKKIKFLNLFLALVLLMQCLCIPVCASEITSTEETNPVSSGLTPIPDVVFGSASITHGCRTINGQTPLGGSDRILETAQAAFVYEANTQTVIYSYNPDAPLMPGALTKIMTALLAIENLNLDDTILCSTRWNKSIPSNSINAKIKEEEELTVRDLLNMLVIQGANDAALILANTVAPNEASFVEMMNHRAQKIGCTNTVFTNCHGLDDGNQYTTARDMAKITLEATMNPVFKELFAATEYKVSATNRTDKERNLQTSNHLMYEKIINKFYDKRVKGGTVTYATGSGAGISCIAEDEGMSLIVVLMGASRVFNENGNASYYGNLEEVFDLIRTSFNKYRICRLLYPGQMLDQFPVLGGDCQATGKVDVAIDTVIPESIQQKNLIFRYEVAGGGLNAPVDRDAEIGTMQVWYGTSCITEAKMYAANRVHKDTESGLTIRDATRDDSNITGFLIFAGIVILVILVPFTVYVLYHRLRYRLRQAKRRKRRASRRRSR
jgi:D-alanyl-D-alanine carboxypeptidase